jgi:sugar phosphate isomerase/epimerase
MRLAVSNIAWDAEHDEQVADVLREHGIDAVEIAPPKAFGDPEQADVTDAERYRARWQDLGLSIISTQSLLFGRPDLLLFGDDGQREAFTAYLEHVLELGASLGARAQVFGSPKNRRREQLPEAEARAVAEDVFGRLGAHAAAHGTALCLEANPSEYGADFLTSAHEAAALVAAVDSPGLRLHLDTACMQLAGDDGPEVARRYAPLVSHVHLSEPQLGPVGTPNPAHAALLEALSEVGYSGGVSVEMRPTSTPVESVREAARYASTLLEAAA